MTSTLADNSVRPAAPTDAPLGGRADSVMPWGMAEYYRLLFDRLRQAWPEKVPQHPVVGFTSCRRSEGVSTVCRFLTITAAHKLEQPVLLLDAVRDEGFGTTESSQTAGLFDVLAGQAEPADVVQHYLARWAYHIAAGSSEARAHTEFRREVFTRLIDLLKREFAFTVVDLPPCQAPSECLAMAGVLDGVVLVVEAERVRAPIVCRARDQLFQSGALLLGVVLNKRRNHVPEWLYRLL
ncbi:MAG: hypothetical protein KatS3mg110_0900 [Pirellulaceae bacterium]|nr:MAG: hypothetical protein KatS3mg110_0900 [Pirellulaceae bacterium]